MKKFVCLPCGFVYKENLNPSNDDYKNLPFDELPFSWECPVCGATKKDFEEVKA